MFKVRPLPYQGTSCCACSPDKATLTANGTLNAGSLDPQDQTARGMKRVAKARKLILYSGCLTTVKRIVVAHLGFTEDQVYRIAQTKLLSALRFPKNLFSDCAKPV